MSDVAWVEVREAVEALIKNLKPMADQHPESSITGNDFNALLERSRLAFPASAAIRDVSRIDNLTTLADLFGKLSILQGAVNAAFKVRNSEAVRRQNDENRQRRSSYWSG